MTEEHHSIFLTPEDVAILTGRKTKTKQIEALRSMGIPFFVNAIGHPIVARAVVEGGKQPEPARPKWESRILREQRD